MSIEASIRTMLTNGTTLSLVPDARVTHGYRLQDSTLPAITFEVSDVETVSCGSSPIRRATLTATCVAVEAVDALAIAAQVRSACKTGTFDGKQFTAVIYGNHVVEAASSGEGDEAQPAMATCTATIFYTE